MKCFNCHNEGKTFRLECGKLICKNCLDELGKEQKEIEEYIKDYLAENFQIINPQTQAKVLMCIADTILYKNGLLDKEKKEKIDKEKERMDKAFE